MTATDASTSGWGICRTHRPASEVQALGQWEERWRFRRLRPDEWAPRRRAIPAFGELDVLTDPRTATMPHCPGHENLPLPSESQ